MKKRPLKKILIAVCSAGWLFQLGCFPDYYFQNLLASSVSEVVGVLLTDTLNVLLPPPNVNN